MRSRGSGSSAARAAALALALLAGAAPAEVPIDDLAVEMKPLDAKVLFRKDPFDKSSFPVTVAGDDGAPLRGTIEVKGSFTRQTGKKSVLIKLGDGRWRGQGRVSLNGMGTDATMMREWLAWELMRALGMVIPQTRYTRLIINGEFQGLFLRIDWIDTKMFERAGLGGDGQFYHPLDSAFCADMTPASLDPSRECWIKLGPRDDPGHEAMRALAEELVAEPVDTFDRLVERRFDAESVVNWFAVNTLVGQTDTYNKNYFTYLSRATGKWLMVPWDYDLTFGRSFDPHVPFPQTILNDRFQYYVPMEAGQPNPLHYQSLKNAPFRGRVIARLRELIDGEPDVARPWRGWFSPARMARRFDELRAVVHPEFLRDPFMAGKEQQFEDELESLRFYSRARVHNLRRVLFAAPGWARDTAAATLGAGGEADFVDGWGFLLGSLRSRDAGRVQLRVFRGWPELVPPGTDRAACVQRSWFVSGAPAAPADLTLTYLDEDSRQREPGPAVADERALRLFLREGDGWRPLPTAVAPIANTLSARGVRLPPGESRLVACAAQPAAIAAVR